jgi:hypothetical protein
MPLLLGNEVRKGKVSQREQRHEAQTPKSRHRHQMLEGYQEQTSTKQPKGFLHWKMVWWVKGLMNHPILNVATSVGLLCTHTKGRGHIEKNSSKQEYATIIRECSKKRKSFKMGTVARG